MADSNSSKQTSNQVSRVPNPEGKGGFGDNPQHINLSGHWKKEDTPRYKLEQMMKLSEYELQSVVDDRGAPQFERKLATAVQDGNWIIVREMIDQVYGKAKESVDVTTKGESINAYANLSADELRNLAGK